MSDKRDYELIIAIINRGFNELVMDSARSAGASGGTVINAKGTAGKKVEKVFGLTVQPEKEIILIVAPYNKRDAIMQAICRSAGLGTAGKGIVFSLPIDDVIGLNLPYIKAEDKLPDDEPKSPVDNQASLPTDVGASAEKNKE